MKRDVVILQNSQYSFDMDAAKIYQSEKYNLILLINEFSYDIFKTKNAFKYFNAVIKMDDFSLSETTRTIQQITNHNTNLKVVTNSEETIPLCGEVNKFLGLTKSDYSRFYCKNVMKKTLMSNSDIQLPSYDIVDFNEYRKFGEKYLRALIAKINFPCFVKPTHLYGAISAAKLNTLGDLIDWAESNKNSPHIFEIDQFITGIMYHCDSFIKNQSIITTFVAENSRPCYNFMLGETKGTIVFPENNHIAALLSKKTSDVLQTLGLPSAGVTHTEFILTKEKKCYFIEIAYRSPGCLIPNMYIEHSNIDPYTDHLLLEIDDEYMISRNIKQYAAWACFPKLPGCLLEQKTTIPQLKSEYEINWKYPINANFSSYPTSGRDYIGTILLKNKDFNQLYNDFYYVNDIKFAQIQPLPHTEETI